MSEVDEMSAGSRGSVANGWIPVTERLPKEYETVLVATDGAVSAGEIRFPFESEGPEEPWWMVFKDRRDTSPSWAGLVSLNDVTHWMPLPARPRRASSHRTPAISGSVRCIAWLCDTRKGRMK